MNNSAEILIHISAPSSAADDARYRRQALGFMQFVASSQHLLSGQQRDGHITTLLSSASDEEASSTAENHTPALPELRTTAYDQVITPGVQVTRTPAFQVARTPAVLAAREDLLTRPKTAPLLIQETPHYYALQRSKSDSWETPPSVVPDSQPSYSSLKRTFTEAITSSLTEDQISSPIAKKFRPDNVEALQKRLEVEEVCSTSKPQHPNSSQSNNHTRQTPVDRIPSSQLSPSQMLPPRSSQATFESVSSFKSSGLEHKAPSTTGSSSQQEDIFYQIRAPPPPTGEADISTHITPSLQTITAQAPLNKYFRPQTQIRDIRPLERGHWHFYLPDDWLPELRSKFWTFIEAFVTKGRAGWGVLVERHITRDLPHRADIHSPTQGSDNSSKGIVKDEISLFCWGEVVGELWLVLWLASDRKIIGLGSQWIDGVGEAIITMR